MRGFDRSRYGKGFLMRDFFMQLQDTTPWIWTGAAACVVLVIVLLGMRVVHSLVLRATSHHTMFGLIVRRAHAPLTVVVAVAALNLVWQAAPDEMSLIGAVRHVSAVLWIGAMTWLLLRVGAKDGRASGEERGGQVG